MRYILRLYLNSWSRWSQRGRGPQGSSQPWNDGNIRGIFWGCIWLRGQGDHREQKKTTRIKSTSRESMKLFLEPLSTIRWSRRGKGPLGSSPPWNNGNMRGKFWGCIWICGPVDHQREQKKTNRIRRITEVIFGTIVHNQTIAERIKSTLEESLISDPLSETYFRLVKQKITERGSYLLEEDYLDQVHLKRIGTKRL